MTATPEAGKGRKAGPLVISRVFRAPRALVFQAWSTAEHMKRWFCPEGFTVPEAIVDFRPGGECTICMRGPDGGDFWSHGRYLEIQPPERLVFTSDLVMDGVPKFTAHTTVTFAAEMTSTSMTVTQMYEIFDEAFAGAVEGAPEGWRQTLDRLEQEVARIRDAATLPVQHGSFSLTRQLAAAPALVFQAFVDPEAKAKWFAGGDGYTILDRSMDVRPGGRERVSGRWTSGMVSTFEAVYFDVTPHARLIYAYEMHLDDVKISVSLATVDIMPEGTGTRLTVTEQGAFLNGYEDDGSRERGTGFLLDRLAASLA